MDGPEEAVKMFMNYNLSLDKYCLLLRVNLNRWDKWGECHSLIFVCFLDIIAGQKLRNMFHQVISSSSVLLIHKLAIFKCFSLSFVGQGIYFLLVKLGKNGWINGDNGLKLKMRRIPGESSISEICICGADNCTWYHLIKECDRGQARDSSLRRSWSVY